MVKPSGIPPGERLKEGDDAQEVLTAKFIREILTQLTPKLAFDHKQILLDALTQHSKLQ